MSGLQTYREVKAMTRIISGLWKGRKINVPAGTTVRPTTDRMRERLFSMLMHSRYPALEGARVADLFAGSGALGFEALSRGAAFCYFNEKDRGAYLTLQNTADALQAKHRCKISQQDTRALKQPDASFNFIFLDPPYGTGLLTPTLAQLAKNNWGTADSIFICELDAREDFTPPEGFTLLDDRKQGIQRLLILELD